MKDITIKIVGKQVYADHEEEQLEFVTDAKLYQKKDAVYIMYEETELSGMKGCMTTLKLAGETLRMKRIGQAGFNSELYFEKDQRFSSTYSTPYGPMDVEVLTRSVDIQFDMETFQGDIDIYYDVSLQGMAEGKSRIAIKVM